MMTSTSHPTKRRRTNDLDEPDSLDMSSSKPTVPSSSLPIHSQPTTHATSKSTPTDERKQEDVNEEWTSSSGSDSDSDSDSDIKINTTSTTTQPSLPITSATLPPTDPTIHTRLTSFFSSLAEQRANPSTQTTEKIELDSDSDSGFEDDANNDHGQARPYIELDLALGVLSEKGSDDEDRGDEIKVPGLGRDDGDGASTSGDDADSESGSERGRLAELTNVAGEGSGRSKSQRRKMRRQEQKRKIEEIG